MRRLFGLLFFHMLFTFAVSCRSSSESKPQEALASINNYPACCSGDSCRNCKIIQSPLDEAIFTSKNFDLLELKDESAKNISFIECTLDKPEFFNVYSKNIILDKTKFTGAKIEKTNFKDGTLTATRFKDCEILRGNWQGIYAEDLSFSDCQIDDLDLSGLEANNVKLLRVKGKNIKLSNAKIRNLIIRDSHLPDLDLSGATIESSTLDASDLSHANFSKSTIKNSFLVGLDLIEAKFADSKFVASDFCRSSINFDELDPTTIARCVETEAKCLMERYAYSDKETWKQDIRKGATSYICNKGKISKETRCRPHYILKGNACEREDSPNAFYNFKTEQVECGEGYRPSLNPPPMKFPLPGKSIKEGLNHLDELPLPGPAKLAPVPFDPNDPHFEVTKQMAKAESARNYSCVLIENPSEMGL